MTLVVDRYELGPIATNGYVVRAVDGASEAAVVDPGGDAELLLRELDRMGARCTGILVTHSHFDHLGGVADLAEAVGAPVYMSALESQVLERPEAFYPGYGVRPYSPDVRLEGGEALEVAGIPFQTLL